MSEIFKEAEKRRKIRLRNLKNQKKIAGLVNSVEDGLETLLKKIIDNKSNQFLKELQKIRDLEVQNFKESLELIMETWCELKQDLSLLKNIFNHH